jgi:hypothetical protein
MQLSWQGFEMRKRSAFKEHATQIGQHSCTTWQYDNPHQRARNRRVFDVRRQASSIVSKETKVCIASACSLRCPRSVYESDNQIDLNFNGFADRYTRSALLHFLRS